MTFSAAEAVARQRPALEILPSQPLKTVEPRREVKKEALGPKPDLPAQVLSHEEVRQVLEKFQPLPPLLKKALQGAQALRAGVQALGQLTHPIVPSVAGHETPEVGRVVENPRHGEHPVQKSEKATVETPIKPIGNTGSKNVLVRKVPPETGVPQPVNREAQPTIQVSRQQPETV